MAFSTRVELLSDPFISSTWIKSRWRLSEGILGDERGGDLGFLRSHPWAGEFSERIQTLEPSTMKEGEFESSGRSNDMAPVLLPVDVDQV